MYTELFIHLTIDYFSITVWYILYISRSLIWSSLKARLRRFERFDLKDRAVIIFRSKGKRSDRITVISLMTHSLFCRNTACILMVSFNLIYPARLERVCTVLRPTELPLNTTVKKNLYIRPLKNIVDRVLEKRNSCWINTSLKL